MQKKLFLFFKTLLISNMNIRLHSILILSGFLVLNSYTNAEKYDPCCSFPCQNNGVCMSEGNKYECDCKRTGYFGRYCDEPSFSTKFKKWLKPSKDTLHFLLTNFAFLWRILNNIDFVRKFLMKTLLKVRTDMVEDPVLYSGFGEYITWDAHGNRSVYARSLPAVPLNCPTPLGVKGKKTLPDVDVLLKKFLLRDSFRPCPRRTSIVFPLFAQHFTHQFFKTDFKKGMPFQWGSHALDLSHIYGETFARQHALRSHVGGKLKHSIINGEVFPPTVADANVTMDGIEKIPEKYRFAIGHRGFDMQPFLLFFSTIWLREHNRVCEVLMEEHPSWDDERLFQTARLILTGETMKIVVEDYVQHLSGYNYKLLYDPELLHDVGFSHHNRIHTEFQLLYRWHALMPDSLTINNQSHSIKSLIFNPQPFVEAGMATWAKEATHQFAGMAAGGKAQGQATLNVARHAIIDGRRLRLQSFNQYRKRFNLKPYKSFSEFTDDPIMARELEEVYGDIDGLEFFLGVMIEKRRSPLMFGQTLTEVGSPYSLKGIFGNPISSPGWWKASTFGGTTGFNIVKTTNLQDLMCRNIDGCPFVSFEVPTHINYKALESNTSKSDNSSQILMNFTRGQHVSDAAEQKEAVGTNQARNNQLKVEL